MGKRKEKGRLLTSLCKKGGGLFSGGWLKVQEGEKKGGEVFLFSHREKKE